MTDQTTPQDPTEQYDQPGPEPTIPHPGLTEEMRTEPDHGEESYVGHGRLEGKRALITGGDSGIGRAVAIAFAREGADVAIAYLPEEEEDGQVTAGHVRDAGRTALAVGTDLRTEEACTEIVERTVAELGGLDILVINAAYQMAQEDGIRAIDSEQLDRIMKTNVYPLFWLTRAALPHLEPGASILTTSSIQAFEPSPTLIDYATSKGAIVTFTKGLAQQLAPEGIRVNTVAPGPIWTPLIPATFPGEKVEGFGENTPLGRAAQPAEVAHAYVFLASQEASYITGERIGVSGGKIFP